ncbi:hypothetical protein NDU88_007870 [Pleurodeles waltl]|uniref:Uncharacterized protein n=1 Tax=Pleurodeles waltl TaxID=8319 RepID=A0AAV7QM13_PLEWA|nr:hypothetical protein NDU88_007870 [Pleurodeles waltl]
MTVCTGSGGGSVPRVLHPARDGLSSVSDLGVHGPAVLGAAVPCSAVLGAAVPCSAVLEAAGSFAVTQLLAVLSVPAGLELAVLSVSAGLVLAVLSVLSVPVGLVLAVLSLPAGMMSVASWPAGMMAVASWPAGMMAVSSAVLLFPDFPGFLWPFPTLEGVAADPTLPPGSLGAALVAGVFPPLLPGTGQLLMLYRWGTALVAGAIQIPVTTGTTGPGNVVAEVLGWDLESRALGDGRDSEKRDGCYCTRRTPATPPAPFGAGFSVAGPFPAGPAGANLASARRPSGEVEKGPSGLLTAERPYGG